MVKVDSGQRALGSGTEPSRHRVLDCPKGCAYSLPASFQYPWHANIIITGALVAGLLLREKRPGETCGRVDSIDCNERLKDSKPVATVESCDRFLLLDHD